MDKKAKQRAAAKSAKDEAMEQTVPLQSTSLLQQVQQKRGVLLSALIGLPVLVALAWPSKFQVVPIQRVALSDMSLERFLNEFSNKKPVVLTGAWAEDGWRPEEVVNTCPHARVRTMRHDDGSKAWAGKVEVGEIPLQEYYDLYFKPEPSQRPSPLLYGFEMTLAKYCPEMLDKLTLPAVLHDDAFHVVTNGVGIGWPSVFFGPKGSETGLHIDTHRTPFWLVVTGAPGIPLKRLRAFPHTDTALMKYGRPEKATNFHFDFDAWTPNFRKHPGLADTFVYEADLRSGDFVYVPGGAPHAAFNLEDSMACSLNFMDLQTLPDFARKCKGGGNSPLCALVQGKGADVVDVLIQRRNMEKPMSYFEFAGFNDTRHFCEAHRASPEHTPSPAFDEYCA